VEGRETKDANQGGAGFIAVCGDGQSQVKAVGVMWDDVAAKAMGVPL
jgi:hypothetical protein